MRLRATRGDRRRHVINARNEAVRFESGRRLFLLADLLDQIGAMPFYVTDMSEKTLAVVRSQVDEAAFADAWEQGRKLTADEAVALALDTSAEQASTVFRAAAGTLRGFDSRRLHCCTGPAVQHYRQRD
jgi:hypothetical protein